MTNGWTERPRMLTMLKYSLKCKSDQGNNKKIRYLALSFNFCTRYDRTDIISTKCSAESGFRASERRRGNAP